MGCLFNDEIIKDPFSAAKEIIPEKSDADQIDLMVHPTVVK